MIFGGYFWFEKKFALANDVKMLEQRLDYKIISDQVYSIQERIWKLEDRIKANPNDITAKEELRRLLEEKRIANEKLKVMQEKGG